MKLSRLNPISTRLNNLKSLIVTGTKKKCNTVSINKLNELKALDCLCRNQVLFSKLNTLHIVNRMYQTENEIKLTAMFIVGRPSSPTQSSLLSKRSLDKLWKPGKVASNITYKSMKTGNLKDLVKNNVFGYNQQKARKLKGLWNTGINTLLGLEY